MANRHSNKPILIARDGKLLPLYMEPPIALGADVLTGGCAPWVTIINGQLVAVYPPSSLNTILTDGDAHVTTLISGILTAEYHPAPCGPVLGGVAIVTAQLTLRGGKGTPVHRRRQTQKSIYIYDAHAFFDATLQVSGEASYLFIPAKFAFIKSLPKLPKPEELADSEFMRFYREYRKHTPQTFEYTSEGSIKISGHADEEYFDFTDFIIKHDDDVIIADILSTDENPFITTTFENTRRLQIRRDDDDLLVLELL